MGSRPSPAPLRIIDQSPVGYSLIGWRSRRARPPLHQPTSFPRKVVQWNSVLGLAFACRIEVQAVHLNAKWALPKLLSDNATGFSSDECPFCCNLTSSTKNVTTPLPDTYPFNDVQVEFDSRLPIWRSRRLKRGGPSENNYSNDSPVNSASVFTS
jgi:hypothetical protein